MAFTRKALENIGLSAEDIDKVMTLHGTSLSDYMTKKEAAEIQKQAIADALANHKIDVAETDEYKTLLGEFEKYKSDEANKAVLRQAGIKDKFLTSALSLLEADKPIEDQITKIKEEFEEYFSSPKDDEGSKPKFGGDPNGDPSKKPSLAEVWGYK